jgi:hypothetical protein
VLGRRFAVLLALTTVSGVSLGAQQTPDINVSSELRLAGMVRTAAGTPIPGCTLRVIQTSTGKAWVSWTDENGKFDLPGLPGGHFRVEVSQLGFAPATRELDLAPGPQAPFELKLEVGTLAAINAPPATRAPEKALPTKPAPLNEAATGQPSGEISATPAKPTPTGSATANNTTPESRGRPVGRNGKPGGPGEVRQGPGGGRRAFQQVGLNGNGNGQDQNNENTGDELQNANTASGQLGQAASADAVQMIGTVAMGQTTNQLGGFPAPGDGGPGGPDTQGAFGNVGNAIPGQGAPGGFGGPGGPGGGGFGGGPGGGPVMVIRGGGGGGRGPAQRGAAPQGIDALMGTQRLVRQRVNRVHFSVYDTFGDSALNARPYSLTEPNPAKISGWTEAAGINIGGPLKIPHVYDGTDKTFFYINFGGTWSRNPVDSFATVPTQAERNGDFSADNVQIYDSLSNLTGPRTLMTNSGCKQSPSNPNPPPVGTCIPTNRISQTSLNLLNYIPAPNLCPTPTTCPTLNFHLQTNLPGLSQRLNVNVTHQISAKLSLQVNYNLSNGTSHSLNSFPGIEGNTFTRGQSVMIGLTQNWTKTFIHTSQLYFSRNRSLGLNEFSNLNDISSQLGITGVSSVPFDFGLPSINFTNITGLSDSNPSLNRSQTYRYVDSLRWAKAKHTISIGAEIRKMDINRETDPAPNGQFSFTGLMTSQLTSTGSPTPSPANCGPANPSMACIGNDFADFLLGYPANAKVQFGDTSTYFRNWGYIGYASDDWHMFPRFTLTYGIRYEAFTPPTEINGRITNLQVSSDFTQVQCVTPVLVNPCIASPNASLFYGHYNNWAPRLGIAWQPPGRWFSGQHQMTIRAGYSMFYVETYLNTLAGEMANQPPFATANTLTNQTVTTPPLSFQTNLSTAQPSTVTNTVAVNPNYQVPYAMIWNASIEYNLLRNTFVELMYTGTRGVHLDELLGFGPANSTANAAGFTYDTTGAFSNFNALQVRLQKRMSRGLMFMARYTYSKSLDDASTIGGGGQTVIQNNADPRGDYGLSSFDVRHQFLGNVVYQLPFGDRQRFATKGWQKAIFGAWRVNSSFTAHSGTPYTVRVFSKNTACQNVPGVNSERADLANGQAIALANPTVQEWFNTAAFQAPAGCFGDSARNSVIGPGAFTINSGLTKTIQFGRDGQRRVDFSWNTTNLLNHVNYSGLSTVLGSSTFGQITGAAPMRSMQFTTRVNF